MDKLQATDSMGGSRSRRRSRLARFAAAITTLWLHHAMGVLGASAPRDGVWGAALAMCLEVDDPRVAWCVADLACLYPPRTHDVVTPMVHLAHVLYDLAPAPEYAVVLALGDALAPDTAGNPGSLFDWLLTRDRPPAPDCPAVRAGLASELAPIRDACRSFVAARGPAPQWSLAAVRAATQPFVDAGRFGTFEVIAIDHRRADLILIERGDGYVEAEATRPAREEEALAIALAGRLEPDALCARLAMPSPSALSPSAARERLAALIVEDTPLPSRSRAAAAAAALVALCEQPGTSLECRFAHHTTPTVARSATLTIQDRGGTFTLWVQYLDDQ